jgi:hypothetical protein
MSDNPLDYEIVEGQYYPPGLKASYRRISKENIELRRMWIFRALEDIGIDPTSKAGLAAIDRYNPADSSNHVDGSLLRLKSWMTEEMGTDGY